MPEGPPDEFSPPAQQTMELGALLEAKVKQISVELMSLGERLSCCRAVLPRAIHLSGVGIWDAWRCGDGFGNGLGLE